MNGLNVSYDAVAVRYGEDPMTTRAGETTTGSAFWREPVLGNRQPVEGSSVEGPVLSGVEEPQAQATDDGERAGGIARYRRALARLSPQERHAIVSRVERQQSYGAIATVLGLETPDIARRVVVHALAHLVWEMDDAG